MTTSFTAEILAAGGGGHAVIVPPAVAAELPGQRPKVVALVNGTDYRSRLMVYGGRSYLGLRLDLLRRLGVTAGDEVTIELELDEEAPAAPASPVEPPELTALLADDPAAAAAYTGLLPDHRAEYLRWITAAPDASGRSERIAKMTRRLVSVGRRPGDAAG